MIHAPERVTISLVVKPFFENEDIRPLRFKFGPGMSELTVLRLAVVESLRPNTTVQLFPPS